jgi:hypothetical protein
MRVLPYAARLATGLACNTSTTPMDRENAVKAIVQYVYGAPDVLELRDIDQPVVTDDDVLVRVHAAAVNPRDGHFIRGLPFIAHMTFGLLP